MNKRFYIVLSGVVLATILALLLRYSPWSTSMLWSLSDSGTKLFPLVSIAALIDSINPCAFSILLLTIAFLFSLGTITRGKMLQIGGAYILGIFVAYLAIGFGILQALHLFNTPHFVGKVGALLLIVLGVINLLGYFFPKFPIRLQIPSAVHGMIAGLMEKTSLPAVFLLGALVGLCEFPCTGGPYLMVIGLLHDAQTKYRGVGYLIWYNILFVLPLAAVLVLASEKAVLNKLQEWRNTNLGLVKLISGLVVIALGLLIFYM